MIENLVSERWRRGTALALSWAGWTATIALATLRALNTVGVQYGSLVGATAAIAIAASVTRSRMRLRDTIIGAFHAGQEAARFVEEDKRERLK